MPPGRLEGPSLFLQYAGMAYGIYFAGEWLRTLSHASAHASCCMQQLAAGSLSQHTKRGPGMQAWTAS